MYVTQKVYREVAMRRIYQRPELSADDIDLKNIICASELSGQETGEGVDGGEL